MAGRAGRGPLGLKARCSCIVNSMNSGLAGLRSGGALAFDAAALGRAGKLLCPRAA